MGEGKQTKVALGNEPAGLQVSFFLENAGILSRESSGNKKKKKKTEAVIRCRWPLHNSPHFLLRENMLETTPSIQPFIVCTDTHSLMLFTLGV